MKDLNFDNKRLALMVGASIVALAVISAMLSFMARGAVFLGGVLHVGVGLALIEIVIVLAFELLLTYAIYNDRNDSLTVLSVLAVSFLTLNAAGIVAIVLRLILRRGNSKKIRNMWYLPAVTSIFFSFSLNPIGIVILLINAFYYFAFGYWFIKYLKLN